MDPFPRNAIIQTVCEIQFDQGAPWDATLLGPIYERVKSKFPRKEDIHGLHFPVQLGGPKPPQAGLPPMAQMQFLNTEGTRFVRVGPNLLSVFTLGRNAYTTWEEDYRPAIAEMIAHYVAIAAPKAITRVGIRYTNRFEIPPEPFDVRRFLRVYPAVPEGFGPTAASFGVQVRVPLSPTQLVTVQTGVDESVLPKHLGLILDIDSVIERPMNPADGSAVEESIDEAHGALEQVFLDSITDTTLAWLRAAEEGSLI